MKRNKDINKEILKEELESIKSTFYIKSNLKNRLTMAISTTWDIALEDINDDVYGIIVMTYVNYLTKNNLEKYHEIANSSQNPIALIQTDFLIYLEHRKTFKDQSLELYKVLIGAQNQKTQERKKFLNTFLWGARLIMIMR